MSRRLAVVLQGVPGLRTLLARLEELGRQTRPPDQVLLLDSGGLTRQLAKLSRPPSISHLPKIQPFDVPIEANGSVLRNIAMGAAETDAVCFLEPGYRIGERYFERALALMTSPKVGFVTSWWERRPPSGESERFSPESCDVAALLSRPNTIHRAALFRKNAWERARGFDPTLAAGEDYELGLRLLGQGFSGRLVRERLVRHEPDRLSSFQRELWRERYVPTVTSIFNKHREEFESNVADVLVGREETLIELADRYRVTMTRRERAVKELEALKQEIDQLTLQLGGRAGRVDWGDLRRTTPISSRWGYDRGKPIDRYYIESFLQDHTEDIRGRVLEIQEDDYSRWFGGERVQAIDVVDFCPTNPRANVIADLRHAGALRSDSYDCIILTQTIHVIDDMEAVIRESHRLLKPGGALLVTLPCLSRVSLEYGPDGDFWRVTESGARQLLAAAFPAHAVETRVYGNVMAATAFLYGLCCDEVSSDELDATDPYHPVLIAVRAKKPEAVRKRPLPKIRPSGGSGIILAYHGVTPGLRDPHGLFIEPEIFSKQMAHLRKHYRPMGLVELVATAETGKLPPRAVAVTFDDGYLDALTAVSPILVKHKIPATFFVITSALCGGQEHWWDVLERIFLSGEPLPAELTIDLEGESRRFSFSTPADAESAYWTLHRFLFASPLAERGEIMRQLTAWSHVDRERLIRRSMTEPELRKLASRPRHSIGAHSVHHLALGRQPDETQRQEVMECRAVLDRLQVPAETFAYPYGDFGEETVRLVRAAGYRLALTRECGLVQE
ncbi:MAG: polysaccharide deacetylase family protein, partial [Vicinamibacteria bacterium]